MMMMMANNAAASESNFKPLIEWLALLVGEDTHLAGIYSWHE